MCVKNEMCVCVKNNIVSFNICRDSTTQLQQQQFCNKNETIFLLLLVVVVGGGVRLISLNFFL